MRFALADTECTKPVTDGRGAAVSRSGTPLSGILRLLVPVCAILFLAALPAQAQERVQARGWAKSSYGRIVFDWPRPVQHTAKIEGNQLTVAFERPMRTDLSAVVRGLAEYLTGARMSADGRTAIFALAGNYKLDSFTSGASVILDLRRTGATAQRTARPSAAEGLQVRVGHHPGFTRLVFDWGDPVDYTIGRTGRSVSMRFDRAGAIDTHSLDMALPKPAFGSPVSRVSGGDLVVDLTVPARSYIRHFRDGGKIVLDVQDEGGDFGGMIAGDAVGGRMMETISPTGEVVAVPAMVGSTVAVAPSGQIPLVTEEVGDVPTQPVPYQGSYTPLTHYDPNATGLPRNLLLYDRRSRPRSVDGG